MNDQSETIPLSTPGRSRLYLAGPEVFLPQSVQVGKAKKALCRKYGLEGVYPGDSNLNTTGLSPRDTGLLIGSTNENLIRSCDFIIANITPFRGPSADIGTAFEMGLARGIGLKVFAYSNVSRPFAERTIAHSGSGGKRDADGQLREQSGLLIEEFGLVDNLMIEASISGSGGRLVIVDAPQNERFTCLAGFEQCLRYIRESLTQ